MAEVSMREESWCSPDLVQANVATRYTSPVEILYDDGSRGELRASTRYASHLMPKRAKHPKDMTNDELAKHIFGPKAVRHIKRHVKKLEKKSASTSTVPLSGSGLTSCIAARMRWQRYHAVL